MKRIALLFFCVSILIMPLVATGSADASELSDYWAKVEAKAKEEGKLVIAASYSENIPEFKKKYPEIEVQFLPLRGGQGLAKIRAEQAAKAYTIDIDVTASSLLRIMAKQRMLQDIGPLPEVEDPSSKFLFDPVGEKGIAYDRGSASGMIFNTNLVPPGTEPKRWKDLADPKWKGKMTVDDPGVPGIANRWFSLMHPMYGEEWLKKVLFENEPAFFKRSDGAIKITARGEYHLAVSLGFQGVYRVLKATPNAPIKFYYPEEGAILSLLGAALINNAPHPNAARVYINWRMSVEGQKNRAHNDFSVPLRYGVDVPYPQFQNLKRLKMLKPFPPTFELDLKTSGAMRKLFKDMKTAARK